ncbi:dihydrolipoyl dehydrogenase [Enterocloster lavalensis]|uniref:dihydrolipoyl dehydrogenase n=1 Tax=Enterocloster lavalensis TaxID=460384 RepID=UPI0023F35E6F|nr:dihydrolipoyl dehydrogenase [Enterocloster lavalensis]
MDLQFKAADGSKRYKITKIYVPEGGSFQAGAPLLKAESGKMNTVVKAEQAGTLKKLLVKEGQEIGSGEIFAQAEYAAGTSAAGGQPDTASVSAAGGQRGTAGASAAGGQRDSAGTSVAASQRDAAKASPNPALSLFGKKEELSCEIAVVGAGPGGYEAAIYAAKQGKDVILIEKSKVGGTCLNVGCIPTKAIVNSAEKYHMLSGLEDIGVSCGQASFDMHRVIGHKNQVVEQLRDGIESLLEANGVRLVRGTAAFQGPKELLVSQGLNRTTVKAQHVIIATGSRIADLPIPGIHGRNVLNSTTALDLEEGFDSIAIVGGGVIGMEFAGIYASLGKRVHVLEYEKQILPTTDPDLVEVLTEDLKGQVDIRTGVRVQEIRESENGQCIVAFESGGRTKYLVADKVLVAVGRSANLDGLKLEKAGVELTENKRSIAVNGSMETSVPGIYAIGDVTGKIQLAHAASHQGLVAVDCILGKDRSMEYDFIPSVIFSRVEIATVGRTERELKQAGIACNVSRFPFAANGKALTMEEGRGFVKLIAREEDGKLVGAAVAGPDASNLISVLTLALTNGLTPEAIISTVFPHPTLGEVIHEAALGLTVGAIHYHE